MTNQLKPKINDELLRESLASEGWTMGAIDYIAKAVRNYDALRESLQELVFTAGEMEFLLRSQIQLKSGIQTQAHEILELRIKESKDVLGKVEVMG